ncbi:SRPBCC family protein [Ningiella sp. W23]|uniref:SRPBCC family protein n=1 Tax=Ningiella sp. W23 TaxID=3023715 RepID=UPI0037574646
MFNIYVQRQINKNINDVFAQLSNHAAYDQFKGVDAAALLERGSETPNGLGALREIRAGKSVLHERIVAYEPPNLLAYKIEYSKPLPYKHELGEIRLEENEQGTLVTWRSKGIIAIPILGPLYFDKQIEKFGARAFGSILKTIDTR